MRLFQILKKSLFDLGVILFIGFILSIYPVPNLEEAEADLGKFMYRAMKEWV
jgi:hypothetical protein